MDTSLFKEWLYWEIFHEYGVWYVQYWIRRTTDLSIEVLFWWWFICLCFYDENNVDVLIQLTPESADTPRSEIPYDEVFNTMEYDMLDEMEWKMVIYVMKLILALGWNMKWMMTLNVCNLTLNKILDIRYTYCSMKQPTAKISNVG